MKTLVHILINWCGQDEWCNQFVFTFENMFVLYLFDIHCSKQREREENCIHVGVETRLTIFIRHRKITNYSTIEHSFVSSTSHQVQSRNFNWRDKEKSENRRCFFLLLLHLRLRLWFSFSSLICYIMSRRIDRHSHLFFFFSLVS